MGDVPSVTINEISGIWSSPNPFSHVPPGALDIADDVVIRATGQLEPRRGFDQQSVVQPPGSPLPVLRVGAADATRVGLVTGPQGTFLSPAIVDVNTQQFFGAAIGTAGMLKPYATDVRVDFQSAAANDNFMWSSGNGPKTIGYGLRTPASGVPAVQGLWRFSGLPKCMVPLVSLVAPVGNGLMNTGKRRTYRVTIAAYDSQGNFYESSPSEQVYIENASGGDLTPVVTLRWPPAVESAFFVGAQAPLPFFRLWRGLETAVGAPSNDEMFLVREFIPTYSLGPAPNFFVDTNVIYTVNDISVDALLNVPLYTNPQTGDGLGILSANRRPPVSACIAYFKGRMYYGRNTYQQQLAIQIIGTGTGGVAPGDTVLLDGITYTAGGAGLEATGVFNCPVGAGAVAANIETTARSLIECIRFAYGAAAGAGYSRQINRVLYAYYASSDVTDFGRIIIERPLPYSNGDDAGIGFSVVTASPGIRFPGGTTNSSDDYTQGGVSWSKPNQPEAVPDVNFQVVGDEAKAVLGFSVHRDCLIVYKEDGAYIVRDDGSQAGPSFDLLDVGVVCVAPQSIAVVSNLAYLLATRGVLQVSEQGTELMSVPIYSDLLKLFEQNQNQLATAFGFGSEATRQYVLGIPQGPNDPACSIQYVLRVPEDDSPAPKWTRWTLPGVTSGCALSVTGKMVFTGSAGLLVERLGNGVSMDYYDGFRATTQPAPATGTTATILLTGDLRPNIGTGDQILYNPGGSGTAGYQQRVYTITYDSGTNKTTLTLDAALPWSGGTFQVFPAIRSHFRFSPIAGGAPTVEKMFGTLQAFFTYFDGDWANVLLDTEESGFDGYSVVDNDPQNDLLGGQIQNAFQGDVNPDPSPPTPVGALTFLRNCADVVLRVDPGTTEVRGLRLGVDFEIAQAASRFKLAAICITVNELTDVGGR